MNPELLIKHLQRGDERAFRMLFEEFYASLCLFATRYLRDEEEAADVVQESFLKYWDRHADFDNYRKIKSFLYVVVRHSCLNYIRGKRKHLELKDDFVEDELFYNRVMEEESHRMFNRAIDDLPVQMRSVINYSLDGLRNSEIAVKMNLAEESVHSYKKEAYKRLRMSLKGYYYLLSIILFLSR